MDQTDLFEGLDEELKGIDIDNAQGETAIVDEKPVEAEMKIELNEKETKEVEATAKESAGDVADIDKFIDEYKEETKEKAKKKTKKKDTKKKSKPKAKKKYEGPRKIYVYGKLLWTEDDPEVTEEEIRQKIVKDYLHPEFGKDNTSFSLDEGTGILVPGIAFQKKG